MNIRKMLLHRCLPVLLLVGLLVLSFTPAVFAYDGVSRGSSCIVPAEYREQVGEITAAFREKMAELRAQLHDLRGSGETEVMRDVHLKRFELMDGKREAMSQYIPDEFKEEFLNRGPQRMSRHGMGKGLPLGER